METIKGLALGSIENHYKKFSKAKRVETLDIMKEGALKKVDGFKLPTAERTTAITAINSAYEKRKRELTSFVGDVVKSATSRVKELQSQGLTPEQQLAQALSAL
ncbi:hypothetical protein [Vibrio sp. D431a]|uniref:hypothetical protein n=1 Tax=Vibrio sp. D431a TaxID=2837388 RepID=UPI002552A773|nr:hypothetical protein [Vibrio sp. D431a]MDK9789836.1 hypothetical protein [Vibrio sp. D431a]